MTDNNSLRSEFLNTQVITRNTGKKLGVIKEILVDIDRREVVAFGLRDNILAVNGIPKYMYLSSISQVGDVILVEDEDVIEEVQVELYSKLVNCEVITETGEPLGKVRDFQFNVDGQIDSIIIASIGLPQIPEQMISTYQISMEEVVSSGPNRLIVFEGAEERITQLSVGLLERFGIGKPPWEREEEMYYPPTAKPENQLPSGAPIRPPVEARQPIREEQRWDEDEWERRPSVPPARKAESIRYQEYEEEDNWGESRTQPPRYEPPSYQPEPRRRPEYEYEEANPDVWDDDVNNKESYNPPPVDLPQKQRVTEYEEETNY